MPDTLLAAHNLGKHYVRHPNNRSRILDRLAPRQGRPRGHAHWALRHIDLELRRGETLGIIGRNGAGKSTLLQLLAGVMQPTEGTLEAHGTVHAMLELGAGFDKDATGRGNVRTQLAAWDVPRAAWGRLIDEVAAFAELGDAFDAPVKTYSSGMFMRLAFAVNTAVEPDVLMVDEVLAVGDVFFRQKCHQRLRRLQSNGMALVLVSHDLASIPDQCDRAIVLHEGKQIFDGGAVEAVARFLDSRQTPSGTESVSQTTGPSPAEGSPLPIEPLGDQRQMLHVVACSTQGADGPWDGAPVVQGRRIAVNCTYKADAAWPAVVFGLEVRDATDRRVHGRHTLHGTTEAPALQAGDRLQVRHEVAMDLPRGTYTLLCWAAAVDPASIADRSGVDPDDVWPSFDVISKVRIRTPVEVILPGRRHPYREAAVGPAHLPGSQHILRLARDAP